MLVYPIAILLYGLTDAFFLLYTRGSNRRERAALLSDEDFTSSLINQT